MVDINRYEIWLINLDPTFGSEIQKTRPCVILSPNEMKALNTVIIAPLTSKGFDFPMRLHVRFDGKDGLILCEQIRSVDKKRLVECLGKLDEKKSQELSSKLQEMFAYQSLHVNL